MVHILWLLDFVLLGLGVGTSYPVIVVAAIEGSNDLEDAACAFLTVEDIFLEVAGGFLRRREEQSFRVVRNFAEVLPHVAIGFKLFAEVFEAVGNEGKKELLHRVVFVDPRIVLRLDRSHSYNYKNKDQPKF